MVVPDLWYPFRDIFAHFLYRIFTSTQVQARYPQPLLCIHRMIYKALSKSCTWYVSIRIENVLSKTSIQSIPHCYQYQAWYLWYMVPRLRAQAEPTKSSKAGHIVSDNLQTRQQTHMYDVI